MQTKKDAEIVGWIGRIGAAGAEHVMGQFEMGRSCAYERLSRLASDGLLEQRTLLYRESGLYVATAEALRWCGLDRLGVYEVGPGGFEHARTVASAAVALHQGFPGWELLSERQLRIEESDRDELVASAKVGERLDGRPALHRPDLVLIAPDDRVLAVEIELSIKAPRRLVAICRAWARARHVAHIYYLATDPAARAVSRAIAETRSEDRITVLALAGTGTMIASESEEASDARVL